MKATIKNPDSRINGRAHRKEQHFSGEYAAIDPKSGQSIVTLRSYITPGGTCYACIWIGTRPNKKHPEGVYANGSGRATGGGYHKPSAAAAKAIKQAGITLDTDIDGRGNDAMHDAVKAIAVALGCTRPIIHHAHG